MSEAPSPPSSHAPTPDPVATPPRITAETVVWAYRLLLGREPEAPSVVEHWLSATPTRLRDEILGSEEMAGLIAGGLPLRAPLRGEPAEAARAILTLTDGVPPGEEAVQALLGEKPGLAALRRHLLTHPLLRPRLFPSISLSASARRQPVLIGGREFAVLADAMEPELRPLPARIARLAEVARAALPAEGAVVVDGAAGIGLTALALLAGAPGLARILAHEADLPRAAHLAGNIAEHAGSRGTAVADVLPALTALDLPRLDLLRLDDAARIEADAPQLTKRGTLVAATLDLRREIAPGRPHPAATLAAWRKAYGALVTFDRRGLPLVAKDDAGLSVALDAALDSPERRVEVFLGPADWVGRYAG